MRNNNIYNYDPKPKPKPTPKLQRRDAGGFSIDKYLIRLDKFCEQELKSVMDRVYGKMEITLVEEIGREWQEQADRNAFLGNETARKQKEQVEQINEQWVTACENAAEHFAVTFSKEMYLKIGHLQM